MFVSTRMGRTVEVRDLFAGSDRVPTPSQSSGWWAWSGRFVRNVDALGLPAVTAAIRLLADTIGSLPIRVYRQDASLNLPAQDTDQWRLLHDQPNMRQTPFAVWSFVVASLQTYGNAYLQKIRDRAGVVELYPIAPHRVTPIVRDGRLIFRVASSVGPGTSGKTVELTSADILHIPGRLIDDPFIGVSPIAAHRQALGTALGVEEFAGRYFDNDGTPGGIINKGPSDSGQRKEMADSWMGRNGGASNAHKLGILWGDAEYVPIAVKAQDAQLIEAKKYGVEEVARIFGVPAWMLGGFDQAPRLTPEQRNMELLLFTLGGDIARLEQSLHADDDLFPDKALRPKLDTDHLVQADISARTDAYLKGRQAGWLSANDIRFKEGLAPIEGGDDYQTTPVGGAPNLQPANAPSDVAPGEPAAA